jgi:hypothetical protein
MIAIKKWFAYKVDGPTYVFSNLVSFGHDMNIIIFNVQGSFEAYLR